MIVIVSKDADFAQTLAEQITAELKLPCRVAGESETQGALLVVTTENVENISSPCLVIKLPIKLGELLANIQKRLSEDEKLPLGGNYVFLPRQKKLLQVSSDRSVDLTDKEAELLRTLAEAGKKGVAKESLLKNIWGFEADLNTHTLETHIYRLRAKLRELSDHDAIVATQNGYRLELA